MRLRIIFLLSVPLNILNNQYMLVHVDLIGNAEIIGHKMSKIWANLPFFQWNHSNFALNGPIALSYEFYWGNFTIYVSTSFNACVFCYLGTDSQGRTRGNLSVTIFPYSNHHSILSLPNVEITYFLKLVSGKA